MRAEMSWVLPSCGVAMVFPPKSRLAAIPGITAHDQRGPAGGRAGNDHKLFAVRLDVAIDRRAGADEGGVDFVREKGLDGGGTGVEGRPLNGEVLFEQARGAGV